MKRRNLIIYTYVEEWKRIFSDAAAWTSLFIISILVALGYTYVYSLEVVQDAPIAIVDECRSAESRQLIRMVDASEQVAVTHSVTDLNAAKALFYSGKVHGIVVIPKDFTEKIYRKQRTSVSGYYDVAYFLYYKQVYRAVASSIAYMNAGIELKGLSARGLSTHQAMNEMTAVKAQTVSLFNPNGGYASFAMPMVYLLIIQTLLLTSIGLLGGTARERQAFLPDHSGLRSVWGIIGVVIGKALCYVTVAYIYISMVLWVIMPAFGIAQRANWIEVYTFLLPFFMSIAFLGLFLIRFFRHREDAVMIISFSSIPFLILSGISWPVESFPAPLRFIAEFVPSSSSIKGFISLTQGGASLPEVQYLYLKEWGLALLFFVLAVYFFRRIAKKEQSNPS
ncbi:ABC transporter permease [Capnocytophaga sp.]|uniref:ABC transporter permease n=1 Tax=Capnocytophaga sp. TaxID=44737 RepID=UPI0026DC216B|nr:ABC transporter permease [Capnocytophaga sp.]MDO5105920.1 ABC transporter permease [Capnocytophaga sp.]